MSVTCLYGMQWGDEGKGRIVDLLASKSELVVRYQGGANAGHTVIVDDEKYVLHLLPSGVIQKDTLNIVGNGVVVDPWGLLEEIEDLRARGIDLTGRLLVSDRAHVVLPHHMRMDEAFEYLRGADNALGTTSRGIGPTYGDKARRAGIRMADLLHPESFGDQLAQSLVAWNAVLACTPLDPVDVDEAVAGLTSVAKRLRPYIADATAVLLDAWKAGKRILLEGAQGFGLDVDHGSYPFVTSSHTGPSGMAAGTGLPPKAMTRVIGIAKAYTTRVGAGPFPTRDTSAAGEHLGVAGHEFGATTGRPRDCGWFDAVLVRRAAETQGADAIALMKLDVLSGLSELKICTAYDLGGEHVGAPPAYAPDWEACAPVYESFPGWDEDITGVRAFDDLPETAQAYVRAVQRAVNVPITMVSVGPERAQFIDLAEGATVTV